MLSFQPVSASDVTISEVTIVLGLFVCHMIPDLCSISHTTRTIITAEVVTNQQMLQYTKWHAENDIYSYYIYSFITLKVLIVLNPNNSGLWFSASQAWCKTTKCIYIIHCTNTHGIADSHA